MDVAEVLALYDREQRIDVEYPGTRRIVTDHVVRFVSTGPEGSWVLHSRLRPDTVDAAIEEEVAYFRGLGQRFEWKVYGHDWPPNLTGRLAGRGFRVDEAEAIMALDLQSPPPDLLRPVSHDVRRVTDPARLDEVLSVHRRMSDDDYRGLAERLAHDLGHHPDMLSVYLARVDGVVASSAWLYHDRRCQFASLWGGSTLPMYRKRGLYTALLAVRVQEALSRGARYLTVDASPMSRPILEKFGFQLLTMAWACVWSPANG